MSQQGRLGSGFLEFLTGNVGGPVPPDGAENINIVGAGTVAVTGNPATNTLTITGTPSIEYPITPYVVGPIGVAQYQTVQSAIDAANAASGGAVYIMPGTYTENLTLYNGVSLVGAVATPHDTAQVLIVGTHTPPAAGAIGFRNLVLQSATDILSSAAIGTTEINFVNCLFTIANGYIANLVNWTGTIALSNCEDSGSVDNGIVNNTSSAAILISESVLGAGTANDIIFAGSLQLRNCTIGCDVTPGVAATIFQAEDTSFTRNIALSGALAPVFRNCAFLPAAGLAAITHGSAGAATIIDSTVNATIAPFAGGGPYAIEGVVYLNDTTNPSVISSSAINRWTDVRAVETLSGGNVINQVSNLSNTAGSNALFSTIVAGASGGDPSVGFTVTGAQSWSFGIDNSDSDRLKISSGLTLGTTDYMAFIPSTFEIRCGSGSATNFLVSALSTSTTVYDATADDAQVGSGSTFFAYNWDTTTTNTFAQLAFQTRSSSGGIARIVCLSAGAASTDLAFVTENVNTKAEKMRITQEGYVGIGTNNPDRLLHVYQNDTATSTTGIHIEQAGTGDALNEWRLTAGQSYVAGIDNSDSDKFKLAGGTAFGAGDFLIATTAGEITKPLQPAFLATHTVAQNNLTGNGTTATVNFTTEVFDQNGDYNGTNTFTAPVTGRYQFNVSVKMSDILAATTCALSIVTSNRGYITGQIGPAAATNAGVSSLALMFSVLADMDAADTAIVQLLVIGEASDRIDVGSDANATWWSGFLAC